MDEAGLQRVRKRVHLGNAVLMAGVICLFRTIGNGSVIDAVYTVASYTYGPLLGLYCFGLVSRRAVRDRWVPAVCVLAPVLCAVLSAHSEAWFGGVPLRLRAAAGRRAAHDARTACDFPADGRRDCAQMTIFVCY